MVSDMCKRMHTLVIKERMNNDVDAWRFLKRLINWMSIVQSKKRPLAKKYVWELMDSLSEQLRQTSYSVHPNINTTFWRNLMTMSVLIEELLVYNEQLPTEAEETFLPSWLDESLAYDSIADMRLLDNYFDLLSPVWPVSLFDGTQLNLHEHT
jgi:hypothetical protein